MGNKILKITESQFKMLVENSISEAVPAAAPTDAASIASNGIIKAAAGLGTTEKDLVKSITSITNQGQLDAVNAKLAEYSKNPKNRNSGFPYANLISVLNGELGGDDYIHAKAIIDHAYKVKLNITATPQKLTRIDPKNSYPTPGTWKVGTPFNSATGQAAGGTTDTKTPNQQKSREEVIKLQTALKAKGYKLQYAGRNGGIDGIYGDWTKKAEEYDNKKIGPEKYNQEVIAAYNARRKK